MADTKKAPKLHEVLAVEGNLKAQADKVRGELTNTFRSKQHHFSEKTVQFKSNEEGVAPVTESQLDLQTTVLKELDWISPFLAKAMDASYRVAEANTVAKADIDLEDGTVLMTGVPATALLELEKRGRELHDFISAIPTLDPAKGFQPDTDKGKGIFRARDVPKTRTKKISKPLTLAQATDKHPAQVQLVTEDVPVGTIVEMEWSGLVTVSQKGEMLERVENFIRAVKKARSRANETEAPNSSKIGERILSYVFAGK